MRLLPHIRRKIMYIFAMPLFLRLAGTVLAHGEAVALGHAPTATPRPH